MKIPLCTNYSYDMQVTNIKHLSQALATKKAGITATPAESHQEKQVTKLRVGGSEKAY